MKLIVTDVSDHFYGGTVAKLQGKEEGIEIVVSVHSPLDAVRHFIPGAEFILDLKPTSDAPADDVTHGPLGVVHQPLPPDPEKKDEVSDSGGDTSSSTPGSDVPPTDPPDSGTTSSPAPTETPAPATSDTPPNPADVPPVVTTPTTPDPS